jgi:predicted neuraminidase
MSLWSRSQNAWTPPSRVVDRHQVGAALGKGILRIGNPVAWLDSQHRLHLFVVGTGLGGWAASRVLHLRQSQPQSPLDPLQPALEAVGQLPLAWLWNLSHLVRHAPLPLADGGMVLPVYFELGAKYPVFAWFNADGEFQGMRKFTGISQALQPALLALDGDRWLALLRSQSQEGQIGVIASSDAGKVWQRQADLPLSNDDSAVAAMRLPDGSFVMLRNPAERGRSQLLMHISQDGQTWSAPQMLEDGVDGSEYSYPAMSWSDDRLWLSYTSLRQGIAWQRWRIRASHQGQP